jgi:hypothetical protein
MLLKHPARIASRFVASVFGDYALHGRGATMALADRRHLAAMLQDDDKRTFSRTLTHPGWSPYRNAA